MSVADFNPVGVVSGYDGWYYDYASTVWEALDDGDTSAAADYSNGYAYADTDGQEVRLNMANLPSGSSCTQYKVRIYGYIYDAAWQGDSSFGVYCDLYINGAWVGEQAVPYVEGGWTEVTFTGSWSLNTGIQVKLRLQDPNGDAYYKGGGPNAYALLGRATYTLGPAAHVQVSAPSTVCVGAASNVTYSLDGTNSGVTITPSDGAGGTFSPSSFTLNSTTTSQVVAYTAASTGSKTLTSSDSGTLINDTASVTAVTASGTVSQLATDTTTQGSWVGVYGTDGYAIANLSASLPSYASYTLANNAVTTWNSSTTDVRAVQKPPPATDRIAGVWYGDSYFTLTVSVSGTVAKDVSFYHLDWDTTSRSFNWQAEDTNAGVVLASGSLSGFNAGKWTRFRILGTVRFRFTNTGVYNSVVSAIMFDAMPGPATTVLFTGGPTTGSINTPTSAFTFTLSPASSSGTPSTTVTLSSSKAGTWSPSSATLTDASRTGSIQFTPTEAGIHTISLSNNQSLTNDAARAITVAGPAPAGTTAAILKRHYTGGLIVATTTAKQQAFPAGNAKSYSGGLYAQTTAASALSGRPSNRSARDYAGPLSITLTAPTSASAIGHTFFLMC